MDVPTHQPHPRNRKLSTLLIIAGIALALIAALLAYILFLMPKPPATTPETATTQQSGESNAAELTAMQRSAANTLRKEDVGTMLSYITAHVSNHNGTVPNKITGTDKNLYVCSVNACDNNDVDRTTFTTAFYTANNVTFVDFDGALTVTDANKLYLMPGAACKSDGRGVSPERSRLSVALAILYAYDQGNNTVEQHCEAL
jgi:hypothetical protein